MAVRVVLQHNPRQSDRAVAAKVGVTNKTVKAYRDALEAAGEVQRWDTEAEVRAAQKEDPAASARDISQRTGIPRRTVDRLVTGGGPNEESPHLAHPAPRKHRAGPTEPRYSTSTAPGQMHWTIKEADRNNVDFLAALLIGEVATDVAVLEKLAARLAEAVTTALKLRED